MNLSKTVFKRIGTVLPLFVLTFLSDVRSQPLGTWAFNGNTGGTAGLYNTVSNADFSPSITNKGYSGSVYYGETNWPTGAINTSQYFQFSLTPAAGNALNILSVVMSIRRSSTGNPSGSGPQSFSIRSSLDNYTLDLLTGALTSNVADYTIFPIGFSLLSSVVTFRVYGYNAANPSGGLNRLVFDNISVGGSNIILAEKQVSVSAKNNNKAIDVSVSLKNISSSNTYVLERSTNAIDFDAIYKLDIQNTANKTYKYIDNRDNINLSKLYYRLSIKDAEGRVEYSNITIVNIENAARQLKIFNMGNSITFISDLIGPCTFKLVSSQGECLFTKKVNNASIPNSVTVRNLRSGVYYCSLIGERSVHTAAIKLDRLY